MDENFKTNSGFKSYVSKPEITDIDSKYLVKGTKNVLLDYAKRIISRNGYTLFGSAASTGSTGIKSSYEWDTSTIRQYPMRAGGFALQFYWNNTWNTLKSNLSSNFLEFAKIWDNTEKLDMLLWVLGETNTYKWSGGATKVASSTATTLTKAGVLTAKNTLAFIAGTMGVTNPIITDSANQFLTAGFAAGDTVYVTGSTANNRNFTIASVTAGIITLIMSDVLTSEAAGPNITIHNGDPTWASARFLFATNIIGVATITIASPAVITKTAHGLVADNPVVFSTTGVLPTGIVAGTTYYVIAAGLTADAFKISETVGGAAINTSGTQSGVHTISTGLGKIVYNGTEYPYTGGVSTDTLTGLTAFPSVTLNDPVWQSVVALPNPTPVIPTGFKQDLIGVQLNQLILASTKSQEIYISSASNYANFTLTSPRAPGDPAKVTMDNYCTCIIPIDNQAQTISSLMFGGGTNEFFQFSYQLSEDLSNELVRMIKLKTAAGSGLITRGAIGSIKNAVVYVSREPALDLISSLESNSNLPISDPVKNDFDTYDFTDAHIKYWKRAIYIALPREGIVLIYDLMRKLWQPPQTIPIGRLAIINDWLYGHSSVSNETYKLFVGTNDNGAPIIQVARFAYEFGGRRSKLKNMSALWSDGYITVNATLNQTVYYGFEGIFGRKQLTILGNDREVVNPVGGSPLGDEQLGATPLGGNNLDPLTGLPGTDATLLRFWQIDEADKIDYTEYFSEYTMSTLDGQFALVSYGSNQYDAETSAITHKK